MKRNEEVMEIADRLNAIMLEVAGYRDRLGELWGYKKEVKRLDNATSELNIVSENLCDKAGGRNG